MSYQYITDMLYVLSCSGDMSLSVGKGKAGHVEPLFTFALMDKTCLKFCT